MESAELTEVVSTEYRADLVVLLLEGKPIFAIVVEVQLSRDEDKRKTWPLYLTSLRARVDCPTALLVVAPDASVARWCAQPIELGHPGFTLRPLVAGPGAIPVITTEQDADETQSWRWERSPAEAYAPVCLYARTDHIGAAVSPLADGWLAPRQRFARGSSEPIPSFC